MEPGEFLLKPALGLRARLAGFAHLLEGAGQIALALHQRVRRLASPVHTDAAEHVLAHRGEALHTLGRLLPLGEALLLAGLPLLFRHLAAVLAIHPLAGNEVAVHHVSETPHERGQIHARQRLARVVRSQKAFSRLDLFHDLPGLIEQGPILPSRGGCLSRPLPPALLPGRSPLGLGLLSSGFFRLGKLGGHFFFFDIVAKKVKKLRGNLVEIFVQRSDDRLAVPYLDPVEGARALLGSADRIRVLGQYAIGEHAPRPHAIGLKIDDMGALDDFFRALLAPETNPARRPPSDLHLKAHPLDTQIIRRPPDEPHSVIGLHVHVLAGLGDDHRRRRVGDDINAVARRVPVLKAVKILEPHLVGPWTAHQHHPLEKSVLPRLEGYAPPVGQSDNGLLDRPVSLYAHHDGGAEISGDVGRFGLPGRLERGVFRRVAHQFNRLGARRSNHIDIDRRGAEPPRARRNAHVARARAPFQAELMLAKRFHRNRDAAWLPGGARRR